MTNRSARLATPSRPIVWAMLIAILLVAFFLRTYQLERYPRGPFGDEAAAALLAADVSTGRMLPVFITAYTGHEVLFYYLSAPVMWLMGTSVLALRMTSALVGVATVLVTYWLARELFDDEPVIESRWLGLLAAALAATSFWHVSVSRYGYRAITLPLLQSLMLLALWRGLRVVPNARSSWKWIAAAGVFCGLVAYTYLSSRMAPIALAILFLLILIAERKRWRLRLSQMTAMGVVALIVFAPLGIFFIQHPETFAVRMTQVSVFSVSGDWKAALIANTLRALEMFTLRGDPQWRFGIPNVPMFQGVLGFAFYAGLIVILWRLARAREGLGRVRYALLVIGPLVMLAPSILADPLEVPHSLRAIGILPLAYFVPALGVVGIAGLFQRAVQHLSARVIPWLMVAVFLITLGASGWTTCQNYFLRWGPEPRMYYDNNEDIADMARYLDTLGDARPLYVSAPDYRPPTAAAVSRNYMRIKWVQGPELFAFAPGPAVYAWPHFSMPDDWWLARFFPPVSRIKQGFGPDGGLAYIVHALDAAPAIQPAYPLTGTFGGVIQPIGFDVLRDRPSGGRTDVAVYWRILRKPDRGDYSQFMTLSDAWDMPWGQGDSFAYPSEQWEPGEIIAERVRVQTDDGTPPNTGYSINLGWWSATTQQRLNLLDAQGRFAGTVVSVGPITVTRRARGLDVNSLSISHRLGKDFDGLLLLGYDQWPASLRQGEHEFVTLYWQARSAPLPDRQVTLQLRGADQSVHMLARSEPVHGAYPTSQWEKDEFVADRLALRIPPDAAPGAYTLEMQMDDGNALPLGRFQLQAIQRNWSAPNTSHPMSVTLGALAALVGYDVENPPSTKSRSIKVTLHWQALNEMRASYAVFVHLVDAAGAVRSQHDSPPVSGAYPTTLWQPGEYIADSYTLALPPDLEPGDYVLQVGMYLPDTGMRLSAGNDDRIMLGKVSITP